MHVYNRRDIGLVRDAALTRLRPHDNDNDVQLRSNYCYDLNNTASLMF